MAKTKSYNKNIIKEYAILLAFYENIKLAEDKSKDKEETPWWVRDFRFIKNKVLNVLRIYNRYDSLAVRYFQKCYKGIDEKTRNTECILPLFAYVILERYKVDYPYKLIGRGVVPNNDKLFDMYDELIEDIARYYGNHSKNNINLTIDIAEKFFKKLKEME